MNIQWVTIMVDDLEKSKEFYGEYLGLTLKDAFSPDETMSIVFYEAENQMQIELIKNKNLQEVTNATGVSIGIATDRYDELLENARERKIITVEPQILGGHLECFFVKDPNNVGIQVIKA
ncbi:MAG: VOC family protein [Eubacteriaceae bacterium]|nr:VOC family protein [Eubacteriaceae bacterium]